MVRCDDPYVSPYDPVVCASSLRRLDRTWCYPDGPFENDPYDGAQIIGSALWEVRELAAGRGLSFVADSLVAAALDSMINLQSPEERCTFEDFYRALDGVDNVTGGRLSDEITQAFEARNIPRRGVCPSPLSGVSLTVEEITGAISMTWPPVAGASSYELRGNILDYLPHSSGIGGFIRIAEGLVDTTYVIDDRVATAEYTLVVVALDGSGRPGVMADPVTVPPTDLTGVEEMNERRPHLFVSPNPFHNTAAVSFRTRVAGRVRVEVFNVAGRRIRGLVDEDLSVGRHEAVWNGLDEAGGRAASGIYFVQVLGLDWRERRKLVLLR